MPNNKVGRFRLPHLSAQAKGVYTVQPRLRRGVGCSVMRIPFEMVSIFLFLL